MDKQKTETAADLGKCMYFRNCTNPATSMLQHVVLNQVPICTECKARYDRLYRISEKGKANGNP